MFVSRAMTRWLALLFLLGSISNAFAMLRQCNSYLVPSQDGMSLFVMRALWRGAPMSQDKALKSPYVLPDGRSVDVGTTFPESGVYEVASLKPLYTWNWYAHPEDVAVSADVSSFAVINFSALDTGKDALFFYHLGKSVRNYPVGELVKAFGSEAFLEKSNFDGLHRKWHDDFEARGNILHLSTAKRRHGLGYQEKYRFDLTTGEMLSSEEGGLRVLMALPFLLISGAIWWFVRRSRLNPVP